jgi:hypothetical protein
MQDEKTTVTIRGKSASSYPEPRKFAVSLPATPWDNEKEQQNEQRA